MYEADKSLVAQTRNKCTGAQVHAVNGKISAYSNQCFLCQAYLKKNDPRLEEAVDIRDLFERTLRIFVKTGELVRSLAEVRERRDNL